MRTQLYASASRNTPMHTVLASLMVALGMYAAQAPAFAASLFGDHSCKDWATLEQATKKTWTNAFLAPLSMAHEDRRKTGTDKYNDDPYAADAAIKGIDRYCETHPEGGAADGAGAYLSSLVGGR